MSASGSSTLSSKPAASKSAAESPAILPAGSMLGCYRIESFLAQGGFGITYIARDTMLDMQVAIKEYLPETIAHRHADTTVRARRYDDRPVFQRGLSSFLKEARTLARFKHPNIVRVMSIFELNGTAYMVMEYERGQDLKLFLSRHGRVPEAILKSIVGPIMDGLEEVHRLGFIHRDIKPANILVRDNGSPVLLDFGSARLASGHNSEAMTTLVSVGYAPLEQYSGMDEQQGPWTDIYALGAVLYFAITGKAPLDSTLRGAALLNDKADPMLSLSKCDVPGYSRAFCRAIDWALQFKVTARPQSLVQWRSRLFNDQEPEQQANGQYNKQPDQTSGSGSVVRAGAESYAKIDANNGIKTERVTANSRAASPATVLADTIALSTHRRALDNSQSSRADVTMLSPEGSDTSTVLRTRQAGSANQTLQLPVSAAAQTSAPATTPDWLDTTVVPPSIPPAQIARKPRFHRARRILPFAGVAALAGLVLSYMFINGGFTDFNHGGFTDSESEAISVRQDNIANSSASERATDLAFNDLSADATAAASPLDRSSEQTDIDVESKAENAAEDASQVTFSPHSSRTVASSDSGATAQASRDTQPSPESRRLAAERSRQQARERAVQRAEARRLALQAEQAEELRQRRAEMRREADLEARQNEQREVAALAARSAIKPPISNADMNAVLTQFNILSNAIERKDEETLQQVTVTSDRKNAYFAYVFRTFDVIDVTINNISSSREAQTVRATLTIDRMRRSNGDVAIPPREFRNIAIYSVREEDWSAIHW